ncbi:hypothetical protein D9758_010804 [Tetrapyrgos nigripes]|uniref:Uncharacterized protein n=1 Tax=Tetrapyrgos nigripes TaxID=182062 RepID=A0A8H5LQB0_9AGAR|nr:hypothetical protein D9758_010804 [Tetrapyrgos nigripes]
MAEQTLTDAERKVLANIEQLVPPTPTMPGLKCGYEKAIDHLPLPFLPPQFFEGMYATMKPPVFHYGWHFKRADLAAAAADHNLLAKRVFAPGYQISATPQAAVDMDVHRTLRNIHLHLEDKGLNTPQLQYACVRVDSRIMISIATNYTGWLPDVQAVDALRDLLGREDEPVWDLDYESSGWQKCARNAPRVRYRFE